MRYNYFLGLAIAFDQLLNAIFGGWADETFSSRVYRNSNMSLYWATLRRCIDTLFFWQKQHCYKSYQAEIKRESLPPEMR